MNENNLTNKIGIYQIRNKLNGKVYIGSSKNIGTRWAEHKRDLRENEHRNKHLQRAYNKYGAENFVFEILEFLDSEEGQYEREQFWINTKDACNKKKGYNIQNIVLKVPHSSKKVVCLETGEIFDSIREASIKYDIAVGSISCCCNKRKIKQTKGLHWRYYEEYLKMTEDDIKEVLLDTRFFPFICIDDGKIYKNWRELPYKKGVISRCCNKLARRQYATCEGKKYMYLKDYIHLSKEEIEKIKSLKPQPAKTSGEIVCVETGEVFRNANQVKNLTGIRSNGVLDCCYHKAITTGGLHWVFKQEYIKMSPKEINDILSTSNKKNVCKPVICIETGEIFESSVVAHNKTGISKNIIRRMCSQGGRCKSKKTLHFMFLTEYKTLSKDEINKRLDNTPKHIKKVRCIETGRVFNSVTEAAKFVGGMTTNISKCCKNNKYICKGFHWEYA